MRKDPKPVHGIAQESFVQDCFVTAFYALQNASVQLYSDPLYCGIKHVLVGEKRAMYARVQMHSEGITMDSSSRTSSFHMGEAKFKIFD